MPNTRKRCVDCRFCSWERVDADGPQWPTCGNLETKEFDPPVFWLHPDSRACQLYEPRRPAQTRDALAAAHEKLLKVAQQRNQPPASRWHVLWQVAELMAMGAAGAGASNLDQTAGVMAFGCGLGLAVMSIIARLK
jgi:hypothetical protein